MMLLSQNLETLKWQKRIIIVYAPSFKNNLATRQVAILKNEQHKFYDYKICFIESTNEGDRLNFGVIEAGQESKSLEAFKIVLIGLDGGVKFESDTVVKAQLLFDLIDGMPMRRREDRN